LIVTADPGSGYALYRIDGVGADATPPMMTCPADLAVMTMNSQGVAVTFSLPAATDNSGAPPTVTADRTSGEVFPVGMTRINVAATDGSNNTSRCSFVVTVILQSTSSDAGPIDGALDAGSSDAGSDGGPFPPPSDAASSDGGNPEVPGGGSPGGCGCGAGGAHSWPTSALMLALVALVLRRRPWRTKCHRRARSITLPFDAR